MAQPPFHHYYLNFSNINIKGPFSLAVGSHMGQGSPPAKFQPLRERSGTSTSGTLAQAASGPPQTVGGLSRVLAGQGRVGRSGSTAPGCLPDNPPGQAGV